MEKRSSGSGLMAGLAINSWAHFQRRVFISGSSYKPSLSVTKLHGDIFTRLGTIWLPSNQGQTFVGVDVLNVGSSLHVTSVLNLDALRLKSFTLWRSP